MTSTSYEDKSAYQSSPAETELRRGLVEISNAQGPKVSDQNKAALFQRANEHLTQAYQTLEKKPSMEGFRLAGLLKYKIQEVMIKKLKNPKPSAFNLRLSGIYARFSRNEDLAKAVEAAGTVGQNKILALEREMEALYGKYYEKGDQFDLRNFSNLIQKLRSLIKMSMYRNCLITLKIRFICFKQS